MNFVPVQWFSNYIDAHIAMGRLKEEGIECWLKDENTVTTGPILGQAVGGIKLMVAESVREDALQTIMKIENERKSRMVCPNCGSHNIEYITTHPDPANWINAIEDFLFGNEKTFHCIECRTEFKEPLTEEKQEDDLSDK
jgi:DNA-directed RNA polymerase subunit RPC12/RpoP